MARSARSRRSGAASTCASTVMVAALLALCYSAGAQPTTIPDFAPRPALRIATGEAPLFVSHRGDALTGFGIELWDAIARRLEVEARFLNLGQRSDGYERSARYFLGVLYLAPTLD